MLDRTRVKALPMVSRAADLAPAAQACCGVCRTCVTTNAFGLLAVVGAYAARFLRRKPA